MDNLKLPSKLLEPQILAASVHNLSYFMKVRKFINTNGDRDKSYFSDSKYQEIFNLYCKYFDKFDKQPTKTTMITLVDRTEQDEEVKLYKQSIIEKMYSYKSEEINVEYIESESEEFIKQSRVYEAMNLAQIDIVEQNYSGIVSKMEEAIRVSFDKDIGLDIHNMDEAFNRMNALNDEDCVSTGFKHLDSFIDGGLHAKEIYILAAIPGGGKTLIMGNIGINAYLEGKNVLIYTFETSTERLLMRYYQNLIGYSKNEIILDEEGAKEKLKEISESTEGRLIVKEYNSNAVCSNDLIAHINDLRMYEKFEPDLIIIDYINIMRPNDNKLSSENSYKYYKTVAEDMRNIAKTFSVPILTATQINREGMSDRGGSKSFVTGKDISESRGVFDTADFFAPIIQTSKDKEKNKFYLVGDKSRNERTGWKIEYDINYDHMKITEGAVIAA